MSIETKLNYKNGVFNVYVKKYILIFPYWSLIYKTKNKDHAITTIKNLAIISGTVI